MILMTPRETKSSSPKTKSSRLLKMPKAKKVKVDEGLIKSCLLMPRKVSVTLL